MACLLMFWTFVTIYGDLILRKIDCFYFISGVGGKITVFFFFFFFLRHMQPVHGYFCQSVGNDVHCRFLFILV